MTRTIYHCYEFHPERNTMEARRKARAQASWQKLYRDGVIACPLKEYPRTAKSIRDRRDLPYLKDVLSPAMTMAQPWDIILWTNDDNFLHSNLPAALQFHVGVYDVCTSQRCEFHGPLPPASKSPDTFAELGRNHMGRDLFASTRQWLELHWNEIPDFILGASDFDLCLACMVRLHFGITSDRNNLEQTIFPADLPRGYVAHEYHEPKWRAVDNEKVAPSQIHNRRLFKQWADKYLPSLVFHEGNVI